MEKHSIVMPDDETASRKFRAALDMMPKPLFAVLDGGHFDDLEDEFSDIGITSRSLFLKGGDNEMRRDGPWLVALNDKRTRDYIEEVVLEKPCAVFWSCPDGEQVLWRHLRTINYALVPDDRIPENDGKSGHPVKYERVLFRHWDPNVLGSVLPRRTPEQFARIFGPAQAIFMNATDNGGLKRALRSQNLPKQPRGLLRLEPDDIRAIAEFRLDASRARRAAYLRKTCKNEIALANDEMVAEHIRISETSGLRLGLETEAAHCRWAFIVCKTNGRVLQSKEALNYISKGGAHPDKRVKQFMTDAASWLESRGRTGSSR